MEPTHEWIFTFGYGHTHPETGEPLRDCYVAIQTPDAEAARLHMVALFGQRWSMQYPSREEAGVKRFSLRQIPLARAVG